MNFDRVPEEQIERAKSVDDIATQVEERERESALAAQRAAAAAVVRLPDGVCANCDAKLSEHEHFCDADCRNDYERRVAARRRNGGA